MTTLRLRPEDPADAGPVRRVLAAAFARPDVATPPEVGLVEELRDTDGLDARSWPWSPSTAARWSATRCSPGSGVRAGRGTACPALALGPVAVAPHRQRVGHGTAVVQAALDAATELGERLVVVLGAPAFYRRFGFGPATGLGLTSPWSGLGEPWQALVLPPSTSERGPPPPRGEVLFPAPWSQGLTAPVDGDACGCQAGWVRRYRPKCGTVKATVPRSPE